MFALLLVRSNYSVPARDALLQRLGQDLGDIPLCPVCLSRESWDAGLTIATVASELNERGAIVVLGLEETPGIVPAAGEENRRPPALSILNHARETIRNHCPHPLVVWCDPLTYRALREHAPDFFDYFTGLFSFVEPKADNTNGGREIPFEVSTGFKVAADVASTPVAGSPAALSFYKVQLANHPEPTLPRALALLGLAESLWAYQGLDPSNRLDQAEQAANEASRILSKNSTPDDWARGQSILGRIYSAREQGDERENRQKAIACFEAALQVYTEAKFPIQWADEQRGLGIAYGGLPGKDQAANLFRAITCFELALRVHTEAEFPRDWARVQTNLGIAYALLPTDDHTENYHRAIACYEAALRVNTEIDYPRDWALTQKELGVTYANLPTGDRTENLRRSIACFEAALRVLTEVEFPRDWASIQLNLGVAYGSLPRGDRFAHIHRAIGCFEAALRVYSESEHPRSRTMTQHNLEVARRELEGLTSAREGARVRVGSAE